MSQNQGSGALHVPVPPDIRHWFAVLRTRQLHGRKQIAEIRQWGNSGLQLLIETACSPDFDDRDWALGMLEHLAAPPAVPFLMQLLAVDNRAVQVDVANIIRMIGGPARQSLLDALPGVAPP